MNTALAVGVVASSILSGTSLLYATLGELVGERAGIVNLGLEGIMLIGAAAGIGLVMLAPIVIGLLAHLIGAEWGRLIYILAAVYAIFAFGEMIPLVLNNYTFMFFTVAGLALAVPNPNPQLWLLMEAAGGGLLIGATIVVGRIIGAPSAAEAAH